MNANECKTEISTICSFRLVETGGNNLDKAFPCIQKQQCKYNMWEFLTF